MDVDVARSREGSVVSATAEREPLDGRSEAMSQGTSESPVMDLLTTMTAASIEASNLDARSLMLVRIAALIADGCATGLVPVEPRRGARGGR